MEVEDANEFTGCDGSELESRLANVYRFLLSLKSDAVDRDEFGDLALPTAVDMPSRTETHNVKIQQSLSNCK